MKLLLAAFLFICIALATSFFGPSTNAAVPSYTSFIGTNGITVSSNPPQGKIIISGSGISGAAAGTNNNVQFSSNGVFAANAGINIYPYDSFFEFGGPFITVNNPTLGTNFIDPSGFGSLGTNAMVMYAAKLPKWRIDPNGAFTPYAFLSNANDVGSFLLPVRTNWVNNVVVKNKVGIGTAIPLSLLSVVAPSTAPGTAGTLELTTGTGSLNDNKLIFGVLDGNYAWIQAIQPGVSMRNLSLQPSSGNVGIGLENAVNKLDVEGAVAIGAAYSGSSTAPANGAIIQGNVGIGTAAPVSALDVTGKVNMAFAIVTNNIALWPDSGVFPVARTYLGHFEGTASGGIPVLGTNFGFWSLESSRLSLFRSGPQNLENWTVTGSLTASNGLAVPKGGIAVGPSPATITNTLFGSASLDFPSTAAGTMSERLITVTGCTSNNCHVSLCVPWQAAAGGGIFTHYESNDVVYVRFSNNQLTLAIDPAEATFSALVFRVQ